MRSTSTHWIRSTLALQSLKQILKVVSPACLKEFSTMTFTRHSVYSHLILACILISIQLKIDGLSEILTQAPSSSASPIHSSNHQLRTISVLLSKHALLRGTHVMSWAWSIRPPTPSLKRWSRSLWMMQKTEMIVWLMRWPQPQCRSLTLHPMRSYTKTVQKRGDWALATISNQHSDTRLATSNQDWSVCTVTWRRYGT